MEYKSSIRVLGLPLVHFATGTMVQGRYRRGVATGWFAIGDVAIGVLFSCGGVALGGISLGGAALGLLPVGGFAIGVVSLGGLALGGLLALGGAAIGWYAAIGGLAVAHDYAIGGLAMARHVITPVVSSQFPISSIPRAPVRAADAWVLVVLVAALLFVARSIQTRREEESLRSGRRVS